MCQNLESTVAMVVRQPQVVAVIVPTWRIGWLEVLQKDLLVVDDFTELVVSHKLVGEGLQTDESRHTPAVRGCCPHEERDGVKHVRTDKL